MKININKIKQKIFKGIDKILLTETIKLWKIKIEWAETKTGGVSLDDMESAIGLEWSSGSCPLCWVYIRDCFCYWYTCPLRETYGKCDKFNEENKWVKVNKSKTWKTWVKNAKLFLKQLEDLNK